MSEIDGLPMFWQAAQGPLTAGLVFECGTRDKTFMTVGVAHMVEHPVMNTLAGLHHECNNSVERSTIELFATGRPA